MGGLWEAGVKTAKHQSTLAGRSSQHQHSGPRTRRVSVACGDGGLSRQSGKRSGGDSPGNMSWAFRFGASGTRRTSRRAKTQLGRVVSGACSRLDLTGSTTDCPPTASTEKPVLEFRQRSSLGKSPHTIGSGQPIKLTCLAFTLY
ncbi:uncharacterized protein LOC120448671 [Drosophila santomea]|uniref:uncharacterized protein LOC120448671 n=1 Tax=Drosophila santomea TaxID=129105 RepID=UPI001953546F|nr:uncharacterized protein LOC120448671 [Drosophila santomea]